MVIETDLELDEMADIKVEEDEVDKIVEPCDTNHHTGLIAKLLKENYSEIIRAKNNNYNGLAFENVCQTYMEKAYDFISIDGYYDIDSQTELDFFSTPSDRVLRCRVPIKTTEEDVNKNTGKKTRIKRTSKTEFVIESADAKNTKIFPASAFDEDGVLRVRVECKTQTKAGSIDMKTMQCIFNLKQNSPEKNVIYLLTGEYQKDHHYETAKLFCEMSMTHRTISKPRVENIVVMNEKDFVEWCHATLTEDN